MARIFQCGNVVTCTICGMCSEHCVGHAHDRALNLYKAPPVSSEPEAIPHRPVKGDAERCAQLYSEGRGGRTPEGRVDVEGSWREHEHEHKRPAHKRGRPIADAFQPIAAE